MYKANVSADLSQTHWHSVIQIISQRFKTHIIDWANPEQFKSTISTVTTQQQAQRKSSKAELCFVSFTALLEIDDGLHPVIKAMINHDQEQTMETLKKGKLFTKCELLLRKLLTFCLASTSLQ